MKKLERPEHPALEQAAGNAPSLAELRAKRREQKECVQRIEALKMRIFRITEQHMDQAVRLIHRWATGSNT
jgi:hypothetical protein